MTQKGGISDFPHVLTRLFSSVFTDLGFTLFLSSVETCLYTVSRAFLAYIHMFIHCFQIVLSLFDTLLSHSDIVLEVISKLQLCVEDVHVGCVACSDGQGETITKYICLLWQWPTRCFPQVTSTQSCPQIGYPIHLVPQDLVEHFSIIVSYTLPYRGSHLLSTAVCKTGKS